MITTSNTSSSSSIGIMISPPEISWLHQRPQSPPKGQAVHGGGTAAEVDGGLLRHVQRNGADGEEGDGDARPVRPVRVLVGAVGEGRSPGHHQAAHLAVENGQYDGGGNGANGHDDVRLEHRVRPPSGHRRQVEEEAVEAVEDDDD